MYEKIVPLLKNFKNRFPRTARVPMEIPILDAACVPTTTGYFRESQSENGAAPLVNRQNKYVFTHTGGHRDDNHCERSLGIIPK
jgi:hypothetical protein